MAEGPGVGVFEGELEGEGVGAFDGAIVGVCEG